MASTFVASSDGHGVVDVHMGNGELAVGYGFRERPSQRHADDLIGRLFVALYQNSPLFRMLYLRSTEPLSVLLGLPSAQCGHAGPSTS